MKKYIIFLIISVLLLDIHPCIIKGKKLNKIGNNINFNTPHVTLPYVHCYYLN